MADLMKVSIVSGKKTLLPLFGGIIRDPA